MLTFNTSEEFFESLTVLPSGCKEGKIVRSLRWNRTEPLRLSGSSKSLELLTGERTYHRGAFKLAYPDVDIKNKSLTWRCQNSACCNPEHMMVALSRV